MWLRRLFTDPTGRDLVALDSQRRRFQGGLRKFLELRDPTCRVPWCDAPAIEADHVHAVHDGGATTGANAGGLCKRHNQIKEEVGWYFTVHSTGLDGTRTTRHTHPNPHRPSPRLDRTTDPRRRLARAREPDEWVDDVHIQDLPLPEDPWGGWIPDPPDDWFPQDEELQVA